MHFNLYNNLIRTIKHGRALGESFRPTYGIGQRDSLSLTAAIALVSWQFDYLDQMFPAMDKQACVDDRLIHGAKKDVLCAIGKMTDQTGSCS